MENSNPGLEDRLRGMILGNSITTGQQQQHSASAAQSFPNGQHSKLTSTNNDANHLPMPRDPDVSHQTENKIPSTGGRKKLNQAQRRQMNSQLSIPIDPGARGPGLSPSGGNHSTSGRPWMPRQNMHPQHHYQTQHSAPIPQHISPQFAASTPVSPYGPQIQFSNQQARLPMLPNQIPSSSLILPIGGVVDTQNRNVQRSGGFRSTREQVHGQFAPRTQPPHRQLYQPGNLNGDRGRNQSSTLFNPDSILAQSAFLQHLIDDHVVNIAIERSEIDKKEAFRLVLERACREAITQHEIEAGNSYFVPATVQLRCFGSMASGFATKNSDMDLALITPLSKVRPESVESAIPRLLEKVLLNLGFGTRLLTKTRVPIIKICERPTKTLMSDLQANRLKFEQGVTEDATQIQSQKLIDPLVHTNDPNSPEVKEVSLPATVSPTEEQSYEKQLSSVFQKQKQSLGDYYGAVKRVLFKLGAYDVGLSGTGIATPPMDKLIILNDVSKAFINGMQDENVKQALLKINQPLLDLPYSVPVSLNGIYCQAEIERLAKEWPSRPILEKSEKFEEVYFRLIMNWNTLAWQSQFNPSAQNRQLHLLFDGMRRINSLQFAMLEQYPHENANQYYQRMNRTLENLQNNPTRLSIIISQYVKGIIDPFIKKRLSLLTQDLGSELMAQKALLFHHSLLELTADYERALAAGTYDEADRADVEAYVALLRASDNLDWSQTEKYFNSLSHSPEAVNLTAKVKDLADPTVRSKSRDRYYDHLSFPSDDSVGIQCDINFSADLALHNTHLLRCYAAADPRVRPLVLFVKSWASRRGINTSYRGTLSSYGYVLMVLHYLVNVATPFVLPNLQLLRRPPPLNLSPQELATWEKCNGLDVGFWRDQDEIKHLAQTNQLNHNHDSMGALLRGFFEYYANNGSGYRGFDWGREVLSLRTQGGIITKLDKGWIAARTTTETMATSHANPKATTDGSDTIISQTTTVQIQETKEIKHRYLFAIEDPFEVDHNVARTVNHGGIVNIRDEFRRAWRIIKEHDVPGFDANRTQNGQQKQSQDGDLLEEVAAKSENGNESGYSRKRLMTEIVMGGLSGWTARGGTVAGYMALDESNGGNGKDIEGGGRGPVDGNVLRETFPSQR